MPEKISIEIFRYDPENDSSPSWHGYTIPNIEKNTVLGALLYIQEEIDSTLAFRYGCRYKRCGLCAVEVDGKPRMACQTYLRDGMRIAPLHNLPLIRDLAIDRSSVLNDLKKHQLYLNANRTDNSTIIESKEGARLRACLECLSCFAECPRYLSDNQQFGGPFLFVKLAQLHFDPRDNEDRKKQAEELGVKDCLDCGRCYCPNGIAIYRDAIKNLTS